MHARFTEHAYPLHTHDTWTVLLVDQGTVAFALDRRSRTTSPSLVTLLPPHVPHDGRAASAQGFRKRVLYLETAVLPLALTGAAVDSPVVLDPSLGRAVSRLHGALAAPGEEFEAASRTVLLTERLRTLLARRGPAAPAPRGDLSLARRLRDLLDADVVAGVGLADASARLQADPAHLVRAFGAEFGLPPHRYLTGRRVDRARRLLLDGVPPAQAAVGAGFYDQSHLTRHFRRVLGTTPGRFTSRR
nr:AraC family transcriptional regulator [Kineococcus siccus]